MIPLIAKGQPSNIFDTIVGVIARIPDDNTAVYVMREQQRSENVDRGAIFCILTLALKNGQQAFPCVYGIQSLAHLFDGDIVAVNSDGIVNTLFQVRSSHNSLFITDRCNSNCLMCSQPPKNKDDLDYFFEINQKLISLMPLTTEVIGITGGEPTILGSRLLKLIESIGQRLPSTTVHMLTNGRVFSDKRFAEKTAFVNKGNLVLGIPLYADNYLDHDFIVQAKDAFNQTILGIHNLARFGQRIEIRIVLHKQSYKRLPQFARFIYKNFPFVEHVAFMGLEYVGYTPFNSDQLWMEPAEYMDELEDGVLYLDNIGMNVSVYNLQLCLLRKSLWRFSKKSISDWKQHYLDECTKCVVLEDCGGVFATSKKLSNEIKAIKI